MERQLSPKSPKSPKNLSEALKGMSPSRVRGMCTDVARRSLVSGQERVWAVRVAPSGAPHWFPLADDDPRNPLRRGFRAPPPLDPPPVEGYAYAAPTTSGATVCVVLSDGRVLEGDFDQLGSLVEERADLDADSPWALTLREALNLPVKGVDPATFYCKLWAHTARTVPVGKDPLEHAVLTDPLLLLLPARPSQRAAVAIVRAGEDWLPPELRVDPWADLAPRLVALGAHLLGAPAGFTLGEAPPQALERLSLLIPPALSDEHPADAVLSALTARRMAEWGRTAPM